MDPHAFAGITTRFSSLAPVTRRNVGRWAVAAALGVLAVLPGAAPPGAEAGRRARRKRRKRRRRRCGARGRKRLCARTCGPQRLCGKAVDCGACCATDADCLAAGTGTLCCAGECVTGVCCEATACANPTPACIGNACVPCTASAQCPGGEVCETGGACCRPEGAACTEQDTASCCSQACDFLVGGGTCASCRGRLCDAMNPCCDGLNCTGGRCDGCHGRATTCTTSAQCCFSECISGACLSTQGGRCVHDADCRECYLGMNCTNACTGGVCTI
jgi:hypothetical protein